MFNFEYKAFKKDAECQGSATPEYKHSKNPELMRFSRSQNETVDQKLENDKILKMLKTMDQSHKKEKDKLQQELYKLN